MTDRWLDGVEAGWSIPILLIAFVAIWSVILPLAYLNAGPHPDVLEAWSVGRTFNWGNAKHPPLMGWIARAWTSVMPLSDWSMQCLSMVNAAIALWFVDRIARRFVSGDKRVLILLLAMLLPAYHLHAQRFNANAVLLAVWPMAIYFFLRSFESRSLVWGAAAGAACALAMLGKYYSAFLVVSLVFAALAHPQRWQYIMSPAPWAAVVGGLLVLSPHLYWLLTAEFPTINYALTIHAGFPFWEAAFRALKFVLGILGWLSIPALVWLLVSRSRLATLMPSPVKIDSGLLLIGLVFVGTIIFPVIASLTLRSAMPGVWALQGLFLPIILVVAASPASLERKQVAAFSAAMAVLMLVSAVPAVVHSVYRNDQPFKEGRNFFQQSAGELIKQWRAHTDKPLTIVGGDEGLAMAVAFYSPDHPDYSQEFVVEGQAPARTKQGGWAALCFESDEHCGHWAKELRSRDPEVVIGTFNVRSSLFGKPGASATVLTMIKYPHKPASKKQIQSDVEDFSAKSRLPVRHSQER